MKEEEKRGVIFAAFSSAIGFLFFVFIVEFLSIGTVGTAALFSILIFVSTWLVYQNGFNEGVRGAE